MYFCKAEILRKNELALVEFYATNPKNFNVSLEKIPFKRSNERKGIPTLAM